MKRSLPPVGCIVPFFVVFILVGATAAYFGVKSLMTADASRSWPTVQGIILSSDIKYSPSSRGKGSYHASVTYNYEVAGVVYTGHRIRIGSLGRSDPDYARGILDRYPLDKTVDVSYDPADPAESLLETGIDASDWYLFCFGVGFIVFPATLIFFFLRMRRRNAEAAAASTGGFPSP